MRWRRALSWRRQALCITPCLGFNSLTFCPCCNLSAAPGRGLAVRGDSVQGCAVCPEGVRGDHRVEPVRFEHRQVRLLKTHASRKHTLPSCPVSFFFSLSLYYYLFLFKQLETSRFEIQSWGLLDTHLDISSIDPTQSVQWRNLRFLFKAA